MQQPAEPDWFLREWSTHFHKRQADLVNELGWNKSRANKFWHGAHPYKRDVVNELSRWLGIEPYELLMHPHDAMQLRQLRDAALSIAKNLTPDR